MHEPCESNKVIGISHVGSDSNPEKGVQMLFIISMVRTALGPTQQVSQAHSLGGKVLELYFYIP
jgi:hypothetical protein